MIIIIKRRNNKIIYWFGWKWEGGGIKKRLYKNSIIVKI